MIDKLDRAKLFKNRFNPTIGIISVICYYFPYKGYIEFKTFFLVVTIILLLSHIFLHLKFHVFLLRRFLNDIFFIVIIVMTYIISYL